jgi:hypothetical protein
MNRGASAGLELASSPVDEFVRRVRSVLRDLLDHLAGRRRHCGASHVCLSEDPDKPTLVNEGQAPDLFLRHARQRRVEELLGSATTGFSLQIRDTGTLLGSRSFAMTWTTRSRSVTIPVRISPSTTGSEPTFSVRSARAASVAVASARIVVGDGLMVSRTVACDIE